jgi:hypothetical protein
VGDPFRLIPRAESRGGRLGNTLTSASGADEHNLPQLIHHAKLQTFLSVYENEKFRTDIDSPGYPPETADRSLALHLGWYLTEPSMCQPSHLTPRILSCDTH